MLSISSHVCWSPVCLLQKKNQYLDPLLIQKTFYLFIYFLVVLGLHCCVGFTLVAVSGGSSLVEVRRLLMVVASLAVEYDPQGAGASEAVELWSCGMRTL